MGTVDDKISSLYHEANKPEPPQPLDDAILTASRTAVEPSSAVSSPFSGRWAAATTVAVVAVITIILVPVLRQDQSHPTVSRSVEEAAEPAELPEYSAPLGNGSTASKRQTSDAIEAAQAPSMSPQDSPIAADLITPEAEVVGSAPLSRAVSEEASLHEEEKAQPRASAASARPSRMQAADSAPFAILTPEMWEVKILQLIEQGEPEQAKAELKQLELHYPKHAINPSLLKAINRADVPSLED